MHLDSLKPAMPRLFVGNFDFEHSLANRHYQTPQRLQRLNAERAVSWLAVAEDGDYLWSPWPVSAKAVHVATKDDAFRLPRLKLVTNWDEVPAGTALVPWGWTEALQQLARLHHWEFAAPPPQVVRDVNARQFSFDLESEWQVGLRGASIVRELSDLDGALLQAKATAPQAVIKANWGMAGRERILIPGQPAAVELAWIRSRLQDQGAVFVEPWVLRIAEAGIQIQIPQFGPPQLIGVAELLCDPLGQYRGSWFTDAPDKRFDWQPAVDVAMRAAGRLQDRGYFGPVGIDAMQYRLPDGSIRLRPLQDINARWTMGRLSLGWRKYLRPDESGLWWHARQGEDLMSLDADLLNYRTIARMQMLAMPLADAGENDWSSVVLFLQDAWNLN
jgi:hypothetical protein